MKITMISGSPRKQGNTVRILEKIKINLKEHHEMQISFNLIEQREEG